MSTASPDDVKRAFRQQIARYHPDKVQHLGREFQAMAAQRAAELTEAYGILSNEERRSEYDRALSTGAAAPAAPAPFDAGGLETDRASASAQAPDSPSEGPEAPTPPHQFKHERASVHEFVRKATIRRFREALAAVGDGYDESQLRGFEIACMPKAKLFARGKSPRLLGRFVPRVDAETVVDAWRQARRWGTLPDEEICIFLMGAAMAAPGELANAIAEQRRKPTRGGKVTLIPVDAHSWDAHMPTDAPPIAKSLLARLRRGA